MINALILVLIALLAVGAGVGYLTLIEGRKKATRRILRAFNKYKMIRQLPNNQMCADEWRISRETLGVEELERYRDLVDDWSREENMPVAYHQVPDNVIQFPVTEDDDASEH